MGDKASSLLFQSIDLYRKWFTGVRRITSDVWNQIAEVFNEASFCQALTDRLNDSALLTIIKAFGASVPEDHIPDKLFVAAAATKQFKTIMLGYGDGSNIFIETYQKAFTPLEFPLYKKNAYTKYSKLKTLLYSSEERPFHEFFVCNTIQTNNGIFRRKNTDHDGIIKNVTLPKLHKKSNYTILVGMGGIGKSMMMRHLFLDSLESLPDTGLLPVMVILRRFGTEAETILDLIVKSASRFDPSIDVYAITKLLQTGKCQLLLDGLDEIRPYDLEKFLPQLDYLIDRYPNNQIVISSRKISSFISLSRFTVLWMMPFSQNQSLELIDKLKFCEEEPRLKQQFREKLINTYFESHSEFVSNPLLLTLMLMNYRRFSDVPEKQHLFYQQAYDTLLQSHDADKLAYSCVFHSVRDPSEFTLVFREFCARSYRKGDYDFDYSAFSDYFYKLKSRKKLDSNLMTLDHFILDVCSSTCIMYEETQEYHFLHRSFQEYFFADYYSRQGDQILRKLGLALKEKNQFLYDDTNAFSMLYELAPERVEQLIFLPYLENIFSFEKEEDQYWQFLSQGYDSIIYPGFNTELLNQYCKKDSVMKTKGHLFNDPSNIIFSQICRILGIRDLFFIDTENTAVFYPEAKVNVLLGQTNSDSGESEKNPSIICLPANYLKELPHDREEFLNSLIKDSNGDPLEFGSYYILNLNLLIDNPGRYSEIRSILSSKEFPTQSIFRNIEQYYEELKAKYNETNNFDDDDF